MSGRVSSVWKTRSIAETAHCIEVLKSMTRTAGLKMKPM
jgi:hypothetical protein